MSTPHKLTVTLEREGVMHIDSSSGSRNVETFDVKLNVLHPDGKPLVSAVLATGPQREAVEMALLRCRKMQSGLERMLAEIDCAGIG